MVDRKATDESSPSTIHQPLSTSSASLGWAVFLATSWTWCIGMYLPVLLVRDFGVPAEAIIVEPHARHTTTNLRNAARLIYRYGIPFARPALVTTDSYQSANIESEGFAKRCDQELGYQPAKVVKRLNAFDLVVAPRIESLQIDPMDPLDP